MTKAESGNSMPADKKIQTIRILSIVTFLVLLIMGSMAIYTTGIVKGNIYWVQHTKDVLQVSDELYASALEAESSIRGYALTLDSSFKESFETARYRTYDLVDSLRFLSVDNKVQQANILSLRSSIDHKMQHLDSVINLAESNPAGRYPIRPERIRKGMELGEDIRQKLQVINDRENELLLERNRGLQSNLDILPGFLLFTTLIGIGIAGLSLYTVIQYNRHRKQAQLAIQTYQDQLTEQIHRLHISNKELEQFAYVASHDLQEPLRKIIAFSGLLEEQFRDRLQGESALYLERIVNSAGRMRKLINDLLNYSRVSRRSGLEEEIRLDELMPQVVDDLEILIREKNASIQLSQLPVIRGNHSEVRQLFQNLLANALKFSKPEQPALIKITASKANGEEMNHLPSPDPMKIYYAIRISDNGIGFDQQYADRIFIIFQRLHGKDKYEGTGIGLAVCKKIAEKLKGDIYAESEPGKGSVFTVILPVA